MEKENGILMSITITFIRKISKVAFNPFHQFEVYPIVKLSLAGYDVSFTNAAMFMLMAVALVFGFFLQEVFIKQERKQIF